MTTLPIKFIKIKAHSFPNVGEGIVRIVNWYKLSGVDMALLIKNFKNSGNNLIQQFLFLRIYNKEATKNVHKELVIEIFIQFLFIMWEETVNLNFKQ